MYVVKSRPSEPAREAEYNAWYEDIDIPDVLEVPGFDRARRGIARASTETDPLAANYVALYDIDSADIDKTIIDLYVAARKMNQVGRSTDALKVVEANYYELIEQSGASITTGSNPAVVFTQKVLCCEDPARRAEMIDWYVQELAPSLHSIVGAERSQLLELYRIMEVVSVTADEIPHYLLLFEIDGVKAASAVERFEDLLAEIEGGEHFVGGDRVVYEIISEAIHDSPR